MHSNYSPTLKIMMDAVLKAGKRLVRDHHEIENLQISRKGTNDFVSSADIASEQMITEHLDRYYPDYAMLAEESGATEKNNATHRWILDPIDGTINFIHGHPFFCISLALEKITDDQREIIAGIVHAPALGETYYAEKGEGAYVEYANLGRSRLRIANRKKPEDCLMATGSYSTNPTLNQKAMDAIQSRVSSSRISGSAALELAYVASGRFDMFVHHGLNPWDIAAGVLLVREAGGVVTSYEEQPNVLEHQSIIACNEVLHYKTAHLIKKAISQ